jgi:hypothetical protein
MATGRGTVLFGNVPDNPITGSSHFHIMKDSPSTVDLFFGDDFNYVKLPTTEGVEVSANGFLWQFGTDGTTTFPTGGRITSSGKGGTSLDGGLDGGWTSLTNYYSTGNYAACVTGYSDGTLHITAYNDGGPNPSKDWVFDKTGTLTFPDNTVQTTAYKSTSGSWTLATGSNTVSITVPLNGNYQMWVNGNVPNGIVEWNATVNVSNPNVPAIGSQYAWYYAAGNALVLTAIPDQIIGTVGVISTSSSYVGNTANVFTFGITNNSTSSQVINWGYTTL